MNHLSRYWPALAAVLLALGAFDAAAAPPPAGPPRLELRAEAAASVNRDSLGHPLSVVVAVYQLKDKTRFCALTFDQATSGRTDAELFGPECLGRSEFTLEPGGRHEALEELQPGTRYLGVVVCFRQPDPQHWRCLARLAQPVPAGPPPAAPWYQRLLKRRPKPQPNPRLVFTVQDCHVRLEDPAAEPIPGQPAGFEPDCRGAVRQAAR